MFEFIKKIISRSKDRFVWKPKDIVITSHPDFNPDDSLTLSGKEKREIRESNREQNPT